MKKIIIFVITMVEFVDGEYYNNKPIVKTSEEEAKAAMRQRADEWLSIFEPISNFKPKEEKTDEYIKLVDENCENTNLTISLEKVEIEVEI